MPLVVELSHLSPPLVSVLVNFLQIGWSEDCIVIGRHERAGIEASTTGVRVLFEADRIPARIGRPTLIDIDSYRVQERLQVRVWIFSEVLAQHFQSSTMALLNSLASNVVADRVFGDLAGGEPHEDAGENFCMRIRRPAEYSRQGFERERTLEVDRVVDREAKVEETFGL